MSSSNSSGDRRIPHIRDVFNNGNAGAGLTSSDRTNESSANNHDPCRSHNKKYKTLERHLSMKKTIRKKMMRDLRDIGDADEEETSGEQQNGFLDKLKTDQPPSANVDKPSLWKRLTKGWTATTSKT